MRYEVIHLVWLEWQIEQQIAEYLSLWRELWWFTVASEDNNLLIFQQMIYKYKN